MQTKPNQLMVNLSGVYVLLADKICLLRLVAGEIAVWHCEAGN